MAVANRLRLDDLPPEVLHRIIALGPCTSALNLSCVNKCLRALSTRPLVYQHIVECGNGIDERDDHPQLYLGAWWNDRGFNHEQDWHVCARWALADQEATKAFFQRDKVYDITTKVLSYLPELLSQRHEHAMNLATHEDMFAGDRHKTEFWSRQLKYASKGDLQSTHIERIVRAVFVYTYCSTLLPMSAKEARIPGPENSARSRPQQLSWYLPSAMDRVIQDFLSNAQLQHDLWRSNSLLVKTPAESRWLIFPATGYDLEDNDLKLHWLRCMTLCTMMAGLLHRRLEIVIHQHAFSGRSRMGYNHPNWNPPLATDIPFDLLFPNTPPPFTTVRLANETSPFSGRHITGMTSNDFLQDGEWIGYYTYTQAVGVPEWDPMMHGIFFDVVGDHAVHKDVRSSGEDVIGPFTLEGSIYTTNGRVRMVKRYNLGSSWKWTGFMTPFGIVGFWGGAWGGWFWLWKRSWSKSAL